MITDEFIENLQQVWHTTKGTRAELCPDEELVISYAFNELDAKKTQLIHKHILKCRHCLELALDVREAYAEAQKQKETVILPVIKDLKKKQTLVKEYGGKIQEGVDKFKAAIEAVKEYFSPEVAPTYGGKELDTYILGKAQPEYLLSAPSGAGHYTLMMARYHKKDFVVLNVNETIENDTFSPSFTEEDKGINQLYIVYTSSRLNIKPEEEKIDADRFIEIIDEALKRDGHIRSFEVDVKESV